MFKEIESVPNLPELEKKVLEFWDKENILECLKKERKGAEEKVYYDGPITANGLPHYAHALTWVLKDIVPRFWSMQGYHVARNMGWDCQGIPVEYEVEKDLKFEKKSDIEKFGVAKFNDLCRQSVEKYQKDMFFYEKWLGRWYDLDEIYSTMDAKYIESMWWSLKELYIKGLLYEGYKVVAYSTRAGTPLSTHEVNDGGYKEIEDPAVTVKFALKTQENTYVLAWTTTPWTMPGNLMLAVGRNLDYSKVKLGDEFYILATERVDSVIDKSKYENFEVVETFKGSELVGLEYTPPFAYFEHKRSEGAFKIIESSHANTEEGTGIVHLAPYGAEDFEIFMGMGMQLFDYLDDAANFTDMIPEYSGLFYKKANDKIVEDLKKSGTLFKFENYLHRMPMCWRTGTPLIYKPIKSWYVAVTKIKEKMVEQNQQINWHPEHLKEGNSGIWIKNARDWALSRSRYWGTPLPVWINDKTGEKVVIGSFAELKELSGVELTDPHKPYVDDVTWEDKINGGMFRRVNDVIDVWYDSGAMPFARYHYPFENKDLFEKAMPAEYIAEGPDQVRLWFYVMHVLGVALFDKVPYKNVVTIGMMLDEKGKKLSKSKKNYKPLDEVLSEFGADAFRFFVLNSPIVNGQDASFGTSLLLEAKRDFFIPLWNSAKYFATYANMYGFEPSKDEMLTLNNPLDIWILVRLKETVNNVTESLEKYELMQATRNFVPFVTDLSTWYIRRSRDRIKDGDMDAIKTLYSVLNQFTLLIAPFTPFFAETLFELLQMEKTTGLKSVHLALYPKASDLSQADSQRLVDMEFVKQVVEKGHSERKANNLKVRQPLAKVTVTSTQKDLDEGLQELILDELNIKTVDLVLDNDAKEVSVVLDQNITKELELEGLARDFIRSIQALRKEQKATLDQRFKVEYKSEEKLEEAIEAFRDMIYAKAGVIELVVGTELKLLS